MHLSPPDIALFYKLMLGLHFFANQRLGLLPEVHAVDDLSLEPIEERMRLREAVYAQPELIDAFAAANPERLSPEALGVLRSWKRFVAGTFFVERFLKRGTIMIGGEPERVYEVLGISNPIEESLPPQPLPIWIKTVLLPFKGRIIYDSIAVSHAIYFGGGVRGRLRETYMAAKQNGQIVTSLGAALPIAAPAPAPPPAWAAEADEIARRLAGLKGGAAPVQPPALKILQAAADLAQAAARQPDDIRGLWKQWNKVVSAVRRMETVLDRSER